MAANFRSDSPEKVGITVDTTTTHLIQKPSQDTLASDTMTPTAEKKQVEPRTSDLSAPATPASCHNSNPFDTDMEAIITTETCNRRSTECTKGGTDCHVWPGQEHWRKKAKVARMNRHSCNCLQSLSKRNRIIVKILIAFLIVGIAVGVGLGISRSVGAGIWRSETQNA